MRRLGFLEILFPWRILVSTQELIQREVGKQRMSSTLGRMSKATPVFRDLEWTISRKKNDTSRLTPSR